MFVSIIADRPGAGYQAINLRISKSGSIAPKNSQTLRRASLVQKKSALLTGLCKNLPQFFYRLKDLDQYSQSVRDCLKS